MLTNEWAKIWKIYMQECSPIRLFKAVYNINKLRDYWSVWLSSIFYIFSVIIYSYTLWGFILILLSLGVYYWTFENALSKEFNLYYRDFGIRNMPFYLRRFYLYYSLFLNALRKKFTKEQIDNISEFAKIADLPKADMKILQHPFSIFFISILTTLIIELTKTSQSWKAGKGIIIFLFFLIGFLFTLIILGVFRSFRQRELELKKFLELARYDLKT